MVEVIKNTNKRFSDGDDYSRQPVAEKLIKLLKSDIDVSPLILDGDWGTGKTVFCQRMISLINDAAEDDRLKAVYIDAFKADHIDEPILMILTAILALLPESEKSKLIEKAKPFLRTGMKVMVKAGVQHFFRQSAESIADEFREGAEELSVGALDKSIEYILKDAQKAEHNLALLRASLEEIASKQPLVIMIDELDRCRPTFAVSVLENIKHIFDLDNVQFVLVTNTTQLQASINKLYGMSVDSKRYLDKFLGFTYSLPHLYKKNGVGNHTIASVTHFMNLIKKDPKLAVLKAHDRFSSLFTELIKQRNLSLREVETFVKYFKIHQEIVSEDELGDQNLTEGNLSFGYGVCVILGIFFYCFDKVIIKQFLDRKVNINDVAKSLGIIKLASRDPESSNLKVTDVITYSLMVQNNCIRPELLPDDFPENKGDWTERLDYYFDTPHFERQGCDELIVNAINVLMLE